jgi:hypothetical protein
MATTKATAPDESEAVATHKEDSKLPSSAQIVPLSWQALIVAWYAGGPRPPLSILRQASARGIPDHPPFRSKDRVAVLAFAGLDVEDILPAVPELNPVYVAEIVDRISGEARSIFDLHLQGYTPVEISELIGVSRPKVYYWLNRTSLKPHKRNRGELTTRQRAQIVKAWRAGEPMVAIASRFNVSYDQVRYAIKKAA